MKLATYMKDGAERWGFLIKDPADGTEWVLEPQKVQDYINNWSAKLSIQLPAFRGYEHWPHDIVSFLELEEKGMDILKNMARWTEAIIPNSDGAILEMAGSPIMSVHLRAPIPRPRLLFGLVQNSPGCFRNKIGRHIVNLIPQGHQRPETSVIGPGESVVLAEDVESCTYNVELGVIIGKKGKNIPVERAFDYVAGYTCINDICHPGFLNKYIEGGVVKDSPAFDWFCDASASWGGKESDTCAAMGPFLTTVDEVGNPYDLIMYTRLSGRQRDRAHTCGMILGIERTIAWYSSFASLYPGDVIHMGTMGVDGLPLLSNSKMGPSQYIEGEIEKLGVLRNPVVMRSRWDWRDEKDESRLIHPSPVVRDYIRNNRSEISDCSNWAPTRHSIPNFWILYGNYKEVPKKENLAIQKYPRFLNNPNTAIGQDGRQIEFPSRTAEISAGIELAFVVKKIATRVKHEQADEFILGFLPMISLSDVSFHKDIVEPASEQERNITTVYSRWADHYNIVCRTPKPGTIKGVQSLPMELKVEGFGIVCLNTGDYVSDAGDVLEFITRYITLLPGDIVTLGRAGDLIVIPKISHDIQIEGKIANIGIVEVTLKKSI